MPEWDGMRDIIRLNGAEKHFGAVRAWAAWISRRPWRVCRFVGHNGAGKSTLMHMVAGT